MDITVYICTGGCGAVITESQYAGGLTKCGTTGCSHEGHQFEKRIKCHSCGQLYKPEDKHEH